MKNFFAAIAAAITLTAPAAADTFAIGVGQEGRGYEAFGKEVTARLKDMDTKTVNYEGSDDISMAVCSGDVQGGIMQIDAIYARQKEGCSMRVVGTYGAEYAYLLVPADSDLDELHDFNGSTRVLVDTIGSGTDLFWNTIVDIETGEHGNNSTWAKAKPVNDPIFLASAMADAGEIEAVLMVTTPSSVELKELIDEGWELIALEDKDINDLEFNGGSLYPREKAEVAGTGGFFSGNTNESSYVVRSFFVLNADYAAQDRKGFANVARAVKTVSKARGN